MYYTPTVNIVNQKILPSVRNLLQRAREARGGVGRLALTEKGARHEVRQPFGRVRGSESTVEENPRTLKNRSALHLLIMVSACAVARLELQNAPADWSINAWRLPKSYYLDRRFGGAIAPSGALMILSTCPGSRLHGRVVARCATRYYATKTKDSFALAPLGGREAMDEGVNTVGE
jgi:hypothetical protein